MYAVLLFVLFALFGFVSGFIDCCFVVLLFVS